MNAPIVYLSVVSIFLALVTFFYNKGYQRANRFLAVFLFLSALYFLMQFVFVYSNSLVWIAFFSNGFSSVYFLIGPFAYLYIRSILRDTARISGWDYIHFVPFLVVFSGIIPYLFSSWAHKLDLAQALMQNDWKKIGQFRPHLWFSHAQNEALRLAQSLIYGIICWIPLLKHRSQQSAYSLQQSKVIKKWLFLFCLFYTLLIAFRLWYGLSQIFSPDRAMLMPMIRYTNLISSIIFLSLNVCLFLFPQILYGLPVYPVSYPESNPEALSDTPISLQASESAQGSLKEEEEYSQFFSENYLQEMEKKLQEWVSEKKFLSSEITMPQLASEIKIPLHHLSYYFNQISTTKFSDWRNRLKIDYACRLIALGYLMTNTVDALAAESGFATKSTFFRAFKIATGTTPAQYAQERVKAE